MRHETKENAQGIRNLVFSRSMTETVKRAIRIRLQVILDHEEKMYERWKDQIREKLNSTRKKQVEREWRKRIQAYKITIYSLTPFDERIEDIPTFVVDRRKTKKQVLIKGINIIDARDTLQKEEPVNY